MAKPTLAKTDGKMADAKCDSRRDMKRKAKRHETFSTYIYKVLRGENLKAEGNADLGISTKGMEVMNSLVNDLFERIAAEASNLAKIKKRNTIGKKDIEAAVRLVLPGDIGRVARDEAEKALNKFLSN